MSGTNEIYRPLRWPFPDARYLWGKPMHCVDAALKEYGGAHVPCYYTDDPQFSDQGAWTEHGGCLEHGRCAYAFMRVLEQM